jgi:hypothetical protein
MNDTELDEILNIWTAPDAPPSLRSRVRRGYRDLAPRRSGFRIVFWTTAAGFAIFLFFLTAAFPQTAKLVAATEKIPFNVTTYQIVIGDDGAVTHELVQTSYLRGGYEVMLSQSVPGNPLATIAMSAITGFHLFLGEIVDPLFGGNREREPGLQQHAAQHAALVAAGCVNGPVVGHETILGYRTVDIQRDNPPGLKTVIAMAPDLSCFPLKIVRLRPNPDGSWRLLWSRHAVKVTVNR